MTHCRETAERCFEAELWRLKGELVLRRAHTRARARQVMISEAEKCFENARALARAQGAHMLERRVSPGGGGGGSNRRRGEIAVESLAA